MKNVILIIGLGNPGREYNGNRHNIGFMCLSHFAKAHGIAFDRKQSKARIGTGVIAGKEVVLARPQTYMNASGESVRLLMERFKVKLDDLVVVHDDLDLPLGKIRIRKGSSAGGHKGVRSIIACTGSQDFVRVRVGIGRPAELPDEPEIIDYVLNDFSPEERPVVAQAICRAGDALDCLLSEGLTEAMNKFNS